MTTQPQKAKRPTADDIKKAIAELKTALKKYGTGEIDFGIVYTPYSGTVRVGEGMDVNRTQNVDTWINDYREDEARSQDRDGTTLYDEIDEMMSEYDVGIYDTMKLTLSDKDITSKLNKRIDEVVEDYNDTVSDKSDTFDISASLTNIKSASSDMLNNIETAPRTTEYHTQLSVIEREAKNIRKGLETLAKSQ